MANNKIEPVIMIILVISVLAIAFYDIFRTKGLRVTTILLICVYVLWIVYANFPVFIGRLKGRGFLYQDDIKGTIVRGPYPIQSSRVAYDVAVNLIFLSHDRKKEALGEFWRIFQLFTHHAILKEIGQQADFVETPAESCSDPKGCIRYSGTLNKGRAVFNEKEAIRDKLKEREFTIARLQTTMRSTKNAIKMLAEADNYTFADVTNKLKGLMNQLEKQERQSPHPPGGDQYERKY